MKKTRVVVIGAGSIARHRHLPEYTSRNDCQVVGLVDIVEPRAKAMAEQFGVPEYFTDYRAALKLKPDAVSVCSPNAFHARQTIDSLKVGAHVLCEKPMALSLKEVRAMLAAAKSARRQLMIGHNQRLNASHVRGKEVYKSGMLGKCVGFSTTFCHGGPEGWSVDGLDCQFFKKELAGLGSLADLGVHKVDFIRWYLDDEVEQVCAMYDTLVKRNCDVDDTAFAILRMRSGVLGQVFAGWIGNGGNGTTLFCEGGKIMLETDPEFPVCIEQADGEKWCIKTRKIQTNESGGQYGSGVIDGFVSAIRAGRKVPIPGEQGGQSVAAILACVQSGATGRFVRVPKVV